MSFFLIPQQNWAIKALRLSEQVVQQIPKSMKLSVLALFCSAGIAWSAESYAQEAKVSLNAQNETVQTVLNEIEEQSDFSFFFNVRHIDLDRRVSLSVEESDVFNVLDKIFAGTDVTYKVLDRKIILTKAEGKASQQNGHTVTGKVVDKNGEPIIGANIVVKGTNNGTITDVDGNFTLQVPSNAQLIFSFIGYITQDIVVGNQSTLNVTLNEDAEALDELVVIGYGTVKKSDLTGSVSSVGARQFKDQPVRNIADILQGRTSGVQVTSTTGYVGQSAKVRVRGTTSINKSSDPLYVVDGIISSSGLDGINPQDIQSMEVLKDASSTAVYGSRGANGVILVTTRKGEKGNLRITFDGKATLSNLRKNYDLMNAYEYAQALNDIRGAGTISESDMEAYRTGKKGIDWVDLMTRTAVTQDYSLTFSGGSDKVRYLVSGNVLDQPAITIESKYQRFGFRANLDADVRPWLTVSTKINASSVYRENNDPNGRLILNYSPTMELRNPETGVYNKDPYNIGAYASPYAMIKENQYDYYNYNLNANAQLLFKIAKGLNLSVQGGYDFQASPTYYFNSAKIGEGYQSKMGNSQSLHRYWQNTNNLSYVGSFGDHNLSANAVWEMSGVNDTGMGITGTNLSNEIVGYWNVSNASVRDANNWYSRSTLLSGILRANYDYKKRYFLTATIRADGSSKFQEGHRWGWFPSSALAWDVAQEEFMKDNGLFDQLKIRGSFGITGNEAISAYNTLGMLSTTAYGWGTSTGMTGYWGNSFAVPDLTWEKTYQYDLGADFSFKGINFSLDWFKKHTVDLLFQKPVPHYNGGGTYWVNQGKLNNTGWEFSVNAMPMKGAITWETTFNATYVKNEILDLAGSEQILTTNYSAQGGYMQIMKPGYPVGSFYVYDWQGFNENGANQFRTKDGTLTTSPTSDDLIIKGQGNPKWTIGWNNDLTWRNFSMNIFFTGAFGVDRLNMSRYTLATAVGESRFISLRDAYYRGFDKVSNKADALYPSFKNTENKNFANSTFWLESAAFLKLKNITISYTLPAKLIPWVDATVSFSAQDLICITGYSGMDPEVYSAGDGIDNESYPVPRSFTFGLKLNF